MLRTTARRLVATICFLGTLHLVAQQAPSNAGSSAKDVLLTVITPRHEPIRLTLAELKSMTHVTVTVHNSHSNADETYSGVRLVDLLTKAGGPSGNDLRGKALAQYIVASGSDGYQTVLAIGEIDPAFHPGEVMVADTMDGKALDSHSGPLKLVVSEDKHPARSVRNLTEVELKALQ
jgi:hypothetical protein